MSKTKDKIEKYRSRNHALLLYPDCAEHVEALHKIERLYEYAYILHNKDCDEYGEIKKEHWHIVLKFKEAVWNTAICKELGIQENFIEEVRKIDNALMYLIHYNDNEKYQYDVSEIKGTLKKRVQMLLNNQDKLEGEKVSELIEFITSGSYILTVTEFSKYCALNGYWSEYRRAGAIFNKIIDEHNEIIKKEKEGEICKNM